MLMLMLKFHCQHHKSALQNCAVLVKQCTYWTAWMHMQVLQGIFLMPGAVSFTPHMQQANGLEMYAKYVFTVVRGAMGKPGRLRAQWRSPS
jgi:hypothetical protein